MSPALITAIAGALTALAGLVRALRNTQRLNQHERGHVVAAARAQRAAQQAGKAPGNG